MQIIYILDTDLFSEFRKETDFEKESVLNT